MLAVKLVACSSHVCIKLLVLLDCAPSLPKTFDDILLPTFYALLSFPSSFVNKEDGPVVYTDAMQYTLYMEIHCTLCTLSQLLIFSDDSDDCRVDLS